MSKTAKQICIECAKEPKGDGLKLLQERYVEMLTTLQVHNYEQQLKQNEVETRVAAHRVSVLISFLKHGNYTKGEVKTEGSGNHIYDYLLMIAETVTRNAVLTETIKGSTYTYGFIPPIFYNATFVEDPKTLEYIKFFKFEAKLSANVYRSMEDAKFTISALRDLFLIGWILGIDIDEEIIKITKK